MAEKLVNEIQKDLENAVSRYSEGLKEGNLKKVQDSLADAKGYAQKYNKQSHSDRVAAIAKAEDPMLEVFTNPEYTVKLVKEDKDDNGKVIGLKVSDGTKTCGLVEVANAAGKSTVFQYKVDKVAELLAVRVAEKSYEKLDERKQSEIDRIKRRYRMSSDGRNMSDGPNPTSNTQLLKRLQEVLDEIRPNSGKVLTRHLNVLIERFAQDDSKSKNGLKFAGTNKVMNYFQKLCYSVVTGNEVSLTYKEEKEDAAVSTDEQKTNEVAA